MTPAVAMQGYAMFLLYRPIPVPKLEWDSKFQEIANETSGFSGREISKLAIAWQVCTCKICIY